MKTTQEIHDMIQLFEIDPEPTGEHISALLDILDAMNKRIAALEAMHAQTANTASCLANGIQPD